jgi:hypothetical protein
MKKIDVTKLSAFKDFPTLKSNDAKWLKWVKELNSDYGREDATTIFLKLWEKRGSQAANTYNLRHTLSKDYNIEIEETFFNKVADLGGDIADGIGSAFKVSKVTFMIVGGIIVIAGVSMAINILKSTQGGIIKKIGG